MATRDPYLLALGARVTELRKQRRLTQEKLAAAAKLSSQYVSQIERGTVNLSLAVLRGLAKALGISVSRLIAEPDQLELEVAALLAGRTVAERQRVLRVVRATLDP